MVLRAVFNEWLPKVKERWLRSRTQKQQREEAEQKWKAEDMEEVSFHVVLRAVPQHIFNDKMRTTTRKAQRKQKAEDTEEVSFHVVSRAVFR